MSWHRMGMAAIEHVYRYADGSRLEGGAAGPRLALVAESRAREAAPVFFDGRLLEPATSAACLHMVSDLVGSRFYIPPAMLARILREADPVVTVGRAMLRFEGFSACCSSYIRHDIEPAAFAAEAVCAGSTNVDFRDRMRGALAQVRSGADLRLTVSAEAVGLSHERAEAVERKVPLPIRWLKGFAEVQVHQAGMRPALSLSKVAAQR
ncbi:MAG: SWIM zinc finger family protein, partial [Pseudomonadota bacterium]